jgi:undecaprenyl diphosphate synthase
MIKNDPGKLPRHIAIIMDGNGRWAKQHALGRVAGHRKGADAVRATVRACRELGIPYLTLYAFSSENWLRPRDEVSALMRLLVDYLQSELEEMLQNSIRLTTIGRTDLLEEPLQRLLADVKARTAGNTQMVLNLALSYGGRDEIVEAAQSLAEACRSGRMKPDEITPDLFAGHLYTAGMPDPDLLIRTSGEYRVSNFLLWQLAYTEFYFTDILWPDFNKEHLLEAIAEYRRRERRFGLTGDQVRD